MSSIISATAFALIAFIGLTNILLGLLVLTRNSKALVNRSFFLFTIALTLWASSSIISDSTRNYEISKIAAQLAFAFSFAGILILWVFAGAFAKKAWMNSRNLVLVTIFGVFLTILYGTEYVYHLTSIDASEEGILYIPYLLSMATLLLLTAFNFASVIKKGNHFEKSQARIILLGAGIMIFAALLTNAILPVIVAVNQETLTRVGPLLSVIFTASATFAIIRHKLFDIRLVVARSLGYLLSIGVLAILYGAISFGIVSTILPDSADLSIQRTIYTLMAVVLAFTFQPLKRFFDRWSNKLFYRDAYDSQELLDDLNKVLVSTIDLDKLLLNSADMIASHIKTEFVAFGIKEMEKAPQRIIGTSNKTFDQADIEAVRAITPKLHVKAVVVDELDDQQSKLRDLLRKNDISVLVRLTETPNKSVEGLGYIVLGSKKSGSPFSSQDIKVLEIIADELVIATQNALRFEEIKNFNVTLQDKVDDATKKLRAANQRLVELDQTKDDFISMASHQLRTPLTSIKGYVSMVMEGDAGKITKKQNDLLNQAFTSSQRMVYLIADLLNVSRLRTGKFVIEQKETNLAEVIEGEIAQLREAAKGRNLELTYDKPKGFPDLMLDETKIRQVIMNFADNAIYYTPAGGHIKVALEDKGETIEFTVTDDGIGVPKAEQHHLFNKFYRAGNAKKARPDGTGLGLFMAKKVVIAQGGSIIFKTQEGKGSTFGFAFNKKPLLPENFKGIVAAPDKPTK